MTMSRLLTLLIILALVATNGPAVAAAMCQHRDAGAHAAARQSAEASISVAALSEETAARAAAKSSSLSDAAAPLLAGYMLPDGPPALPFRIIVPASTRLSNAPEPGGRSVRPLLEPPLA
jgi:hypothetical protein